MRDTNFRESFADFPEPRHILGLETRRRMRCFQTFLREEGTGFDAHGSWWERVNKFENLIKQLIRKVLYAFPICHNRFQNFDPTYEPVPTAESKPNFWAIKPEELPPELLKQASRKDVEFSRLIRGPTGQTMEDERKSSHYHQRKI